MKVICILVAVLALTSALNVKKGLHKQAINMMDVDHLYEITYELRDIVEEASHHIADKLEDEIAIWHELENSPAMGDLTDFADAHP